MANTPYVPSTFGSRTRKLGQAIGGAFNNLKSGLGTFGTFFQGMQGQGIMNSQGVRNLMAPKPQVVQPIQPTQPTTPIQTAVTNPSTFNQPVTPQVLASTSTLPPVSTVATSANPYQEQSDALKSKLMSEGKIDASGNIILPGGAKPTIESPTFTANTTAIPNISPEAQAGVAQAEQAYQDSLKISPTELSTQEDLDNIIESAQRGFRDTKGQPIAMDFITGQMKAIEERALGMAEPLERKLARLQAARQASLEASKFALERSDKKLEGEKSQAETIRKENITAEQKAREMTETARQFGVEQQGAAEGRDLTREQIAQNKLQQDRQFEEDKRQFGLNYALQQRQTAATEMNARTSAAKAAQEAAGATSPDVSNNLSLVNDILNSGNIAAITGIKGISNYIPGSATQYTKNQYNQLVAALSLENRQKLKGSGAISDFEAKTLERAASSLGTNLKNADMERELRKVKGVFLTANGGSASVTITDPKTGQAKTGDANRDQINSATQQGFLVEYK